MLCIISVAAMVAGPVVASEDAGCFMNKIEAEHSNTELRNVRSNHSINITNETNAAITYTVELRNQIMSGAWWADNQKLQYNVTLQPGQNVTEAKVLSKDLLFVSSRSFQTQAATTVSVGGRQLKQCLSQNVGIIY